MPRKKVDSITSTSTTTTTVDSLQSVAQGGREPRRVSAPPTSPPAAHMQAVDRLMSDMDRSRGRLERIVALLEPLLHAGDSGMGVHVPSTMRHLVQAQSWLDNFLVHLGQQQKRFTDFGSVAETHMNQFEATVCGFAAGHPRFALAIRRWASIKPEIVLPLRQAGSAVEAVIALSADTLDFLLHLGDYFNDIDLLLPPTSIDAMHIARVLAITEQAVRLASRELKRSFVSVEERRLEMELDDMYTDVAEVLKERLVFTDTVTVEKVRNEQWAKSLQRNMTLNMHIFETTILLTNTAHDLREEVILGPFHKADTSLFLGKVSKGKHLLLRVAQGSPPAYADFVLSHTVMDPEIADSIVMPPSKWEFVPELSGLLCTRKSEPQSLPPSVAPSPCASRTSSKHGTRPAAAAEAAAAFAASELTEKLARLEESKVYEAQQPEKHDKQQQQQQQQQIERESLQLQQQPAADDEARAAMANLRTKVESVISSLQAINNWASAPTTELLTKGSTDHMNTRMRRMASRLLEEDTQQLAASLAEKKGALLGNMDNSPPPQPVYVPPSGHPIPSRRRSSIANNMNEPPLSGRSAALNKRASDLTCDEESFTLTSPRRTSKEPKSPILSRSGSAKSINSGVHTTV